MGHLLRTRLFRAFQAIVLIIGLCPGNVTALPVDNGLIGEPEVECGPDAIFVNFNTRNVFEGHVYVKDHYNDLGCRQDATRTPSAFIQVPFTKCGVRRQRSLSPSGIYVLAEVIITFHPQFLTKVDRAYEIRCFYMQSDKTVSSQLEVSMLTTLVRSQSIPMPVCRYEVLRGGPAGPVVRYAIIGDSVYHKWSCDTETIDVYCMTVHSCSVDDGITQDSFLLLDNNGCARDRHLLQNLQYLSDLMAGQESHVFRYADRPTVYFQCQITLFFKENNACLRPTCATINTSSSSPTPPAYGVRVKRVIDSGRNSADVLTVDVFSEGVQVLDLQDQVGDLAAASRRNDNAGTSAVSDDARVCLSLPLFSAVAVLLLLVLIVALAAAGYICCRKKAVRCTADGSAQLKTSQYN